MACKRSQVVRDGINDMFLNENLSVYYKKCHTLGFHEGNFEKPISNFV